MSIAEPSLIVTAPPELKVSVPVLNPLTRLTEVVPEKLPSPVTVVEVAPASESAAVELRFALPAVFTPTRSMFESSAIVTLPAEVNVSVPVLNVPDPRLIDVPLKLARPPTLMLPESVIAPVLVSVTSPTGLLIPEIFTPPTPSSTTLPLVVLVALNTPSAFALPSVVPPTELVVSVPAVIGCVWPIVPAMAVSVTASAGVPAAPTVRPVLVVLPEPSFEVIEPMLKPVASR